MLNRTIKKAKLYSPTINKRFKKLSVKRRDYLQKCDLNRAVNHFKFPKIMVNRRCEVVTSRKAKHLLKKNIYSKKLINAKNIITPKQLDSNCWFNTFFVNFFISDRGRQFTKYLRHAMIEGKRLNKDEFSNSEKKILSYLNLAIDACLTGNEIMKNFDTNKIILYLFKLFKHKYRAQFINVGEAGNPIECYEDMIHNIEGNKYSPFMFVLSPKHLYKTDTFYWNLNSKAPPYTEYKDTNDVKLPKYWIKRTHPDLMSKWTTSDIVTWLMNTFKYQIPHNKLKVIKQRIINKKLKGSQLYTASYDTTYNKQIKHELEYNKRHISQFKKTKHYYYNIKTKISEIFKGEVLLPNPNSWSSSFSGNNIPTLIIVELHNGKQFNDNNTKETNYSKLIQKKNIINLITRDNKKIKYHLDSIIIRDTKNIHFCSVLTYNKRLYKFDGASFSTLVPFHWKSTLNKNKDWGFNDRSLRWNFTDGSQMLFYYRI